MVTFCKELLLTVGLVIAILGPASGMQNIGVIGAYGWRNTSPLPVCGAVRSRAHQ
jgi:hypothetical protein